MATLKRRIPRLFLQRDLVGSTLALDDREAHYLGHVLRLKRGDQLVAFNGRGRERLASVSTLNRRGAELELNQTIDALSESALAITLVQSFAKADAMDLIMQKATELGVHAVVPVYTQFSVVKLDEERAQRRLEHWNRVAQSACEQCGRHRPPRIESPEPLAASLAKLRAQDLKLVLDPGAKARVADAARPIAGVTFVVGPEGGLSSGDFEQVDASGFHRVHLGPRVLRTETAAIAACTAAQSLWGDF
ncbi:MAG TPA: 16S rRNA (uracil(1498)-N(3))-methyltransferase [Gammaproteobacteria bacterium]|nr:16S rRNA (uracil(1498)-N(3))-methyltransferase [Gammaproteobacteria bacterium]